MARYPEILAGNRITAELLDSMLPDVVAKSAVEAVTASTTLQDDDELFAAVEANATYEVILDLLHDSPTAGDIQFTFSGPTGATMNWGMVGIHLLQTSSTTVEVVTMPSRVIDEVNSVGGGAAAGTYSMARGILITSTTAGTINFRWAQNAASGTSNVRAGSKLSVRRIA